MTRHDSDKLRAFEQTLNREQLDAVMADDGPALTLAGAGSGKTRVLTGRAFYLIAAKHVHPSALVVMTFTNKAAGELRQRLASYLGDHADLPWAGTFHGFCARLLRTHGAAIGIPRDFSIYDTSDTEQTLTAILAERRIGRDALTASVARSWISFVKNGGILSGRHPMHASVSALTKEYDERLRLAHALDFDDLIRLPLDLFRNDPGILSSIQRRYDHVLIDEFQDTNRHQYELARVLAAPQHNLFVVGDDDQSIYGWRGADHRNILDFRKDFPSARVFRLEQNYRSTQPILDVANAIISANHRREEKKLWTDKTEGQKVTLKQTAHAMDEAQEVIGEIHQLVKQKGCRYRDCAVLLRTNALSRPFEEVLISQAIPYVVIGGIRFYERKEVKDLVAYLRLMVNPDDDQACRRVLRTPSRGIGDVTLQLLEAAARRRQCGIGTVILDLDRSPEIPRAARLRLDSASAELLAMRGAINDSPLVDSVDSVLSRSGLEKFYWDDDHETAEERCANVRQVVEAARERSIIHPEYGLIDFLNEIALVSDIDDYDEVPDRVTLMTIHSAKGLEYPVVFVAALEDGILPHQRSLETPSELEEERRLLYVAITRAKDRLYLSYAQNRYVSGIMSWQEPSRFLRDIPPEHLRGWTLPGRGRRISDAMHGDDFSAETLFRRTRSGNGSKVPEVFVASLYRIGDVVEHPEFGTGIVTAKAGSSDDLKIRVAFEGMGSKLLAVKYAPLKKIT